MTTFVGIVTGVMGKEAIEGVTMASSKGTSANKAAASIASALGISGVIEVAQHAAKPYQHNVSVGGTQVLRIIDIETAPRQKIPAAYRPATVKAEAAPKAAAIAPKAAATKAAPKATTRKAAVVEAAPVKRGPGRPKGSKNAPKVEVAAPTTRKVRMGTTRPSN